jgi:hypothetical protein
MLGDLDLPEAGVEMLSDEVLLCLLRLKHFVIHMTNTMLQVLNL